MTQLSGRIYWIIEDFNFEGTRKIRLDNKKKYSHEDSEHSTTKIENVIIDDFVLKFSTLPYDCDGEAFSYFVNLTSLDKEFIYKGQATSQTDEDERIEVSCELFENRKKYFLYGTWKEYDSVYTWWASIYK